MNTLLSLKYWFSSRVERIIFSATSLPALARKPVGSVFLFRNSSFEIGAIRSAGPPFPSLGRNKEPNPLLNIFSLVLDFVQMEVVVLNLMIPTTKIIMEYLLSRVLVRLVVNGLEVASWLVELLVVLRMCNWLDVHFCICWRVALHHFSCRSLVVQLNLREKSYRSGEVFTVLALFDSLRVLASGVVLHERRVRRSMVSKRDFE